MLCKITCSHIGFFYCKRLFLLYCITISHNHWFFKKISFACLAFISFVETLLIWMYIYWFLTSCNGLWDFHMTLYSLTSLCSNFTWSGCTCFGSCCGFFFLKKKNIIIKCFVFSPTSCLPLGTLFLETGDFVQVDIPIKYLGFFLDDDAELEHIRKVRCLYLSLDQNWKCSCQTECICFSKLSFSSFV